MMAVTSKRPVWFFNQSVDKWEPAQSEEQWRVDRKKVEEQTGDGLLTRRDEEVGNKMVKLQETMR
jgi:hypothetical protein